MFISSFKKCTCLNRIKLKFQIQSCMFQSHILPISFSMRSGKKEIMHDLLRTKYKLKLTWEKFIKSGSEAKIPSHPMEETLFSQNKSP